MSVEQALTGGRVTAGVVRVGDEVRRPLGEHSVFAHAVWRWAIISDTEQLALDEQVRRVRLMRDAYGAVGGRELLDAVVANQHRVIAAAELGGDRASSVWHRGERDWFAANRDAFAAGLR